MKNFSIYNDVTIVIVLFKETEELICETLTKVLGFKIIIIDNDSNLILKKKLSSKFSFEKYILNQKNLGFSSGYNQGIKLSNTKYTLVLGPDCLIEKNDIEILVSKLKIYRNALIVSPTSYDKHKKLTYAGGPLPENGEKNIVLLISGDVCVESALGACMLFETKKLLKYDLLFDELFFLYFSDDDLCRRIKYLKKSVIQVFEAKCIHQHGILKTKNRFVKIFIREYNFTYDKFYYFYKINQHDELIKKFKNKIIKYLIKSIIKLIFFQIVDFIKIYSNLLAYYKFKKNFLN